MHGLSLSRKYGSYSTQLSLYTGKLQTCFQSDQWHYGTALLCHLLVTPARQVGTEHMKRSCHPTLSDSPAAAITLSRIYQC